MKHLVEVFRWEQDGSGGDNGTATFVIDGVEVAVPMYSFKDANRLSTAISAALKEAHYDGRVSMLNQVSRTVP
jgi:hypothetical protein